MFVACDLFTSTIKFQKLNKKNLDKLLLKKINKNNLKIIDTSSKQFKKNLDKVKIYWGNRLDINLAKKMKNLKWIDYGSTGYSEKIYEYAKLNNIKVTNTKKIFDEAVASTVLAFLFSISRGINYIFPLKINKKLSRKFYSDITHQIKDVFGSKILFVGYGGIAKKIAKVCRSMKMQIYIIRSKKRDLPGNKKTFLLSDLCQIIKGKDFIINTLPLNKDTKDIFDNKIFNKMSKDSIFINVGRGETVNEMSLYKAIKNKKILGSGIDVVKKEPIKNSSQLLKFDNLLVTPHVAGITINYCKHQIKLFSENFTRFIKKKGLINRVI